MLGFAPEVEAKAKIEKDLEDSHIQQLRISEAELETARVEKEFEILRE